MKNLARLDNFFTYGGFKFHVPCAQLWNAHPTSLIMTTMNCKHATLGLEAVINCLLNLVSAPIYNKKALPVNSFENNVESATPHLNTRIVMLANSNANAKSHYQKLQKKK
ncbi:hypothetical protein CIPAW_06G008800 [Carya illinoinensis]|uniref:Uncharacterized protein n=1 Tax=Carya illinoinensis TaxID=32201 RepID=A0A8T1PZG2_CARIL|nr:hypothetical protein CIPAW_06G008800 [Carya illinoinensis]